MIIPVKFDESTLWFRGCCLKKIVDRHRTDGRTDDRRTDDRQ